MEQKKTNKIRSLESYLNFNRIKENLVKMYLNKTTDDGFLSRNLFYL